jgi:hypothetical protein
MSWYFAITLTLVGVALTAFLWTRLRDPSRGWGQAPTLLRYGTGFLSVWVILNLAFFALKTSVVVPTPSGGLREKLASYRLHAETYDLVFVGDSRTYCAMHPDLVDDRLGTRSINLARWGHWFPTQHAQFRDLLSSVPKRATVVWSVGHLNFERINERINTAYPIGLAQAPGYLQLGHPAHRLTENLIYYNPVTNLFGRLPQLRQKVDDALGRVVWTSEPTAGPSGPAAEQATAIVRRIRDHPQTAGWELLQDGDQVTSLAIFKTNGAYYRIELAPAFFRGKQREDALAKRESAASSPSAYEPDSAYWNQFLAILDLFEAHDTRLIVNELEEAPHQYATAEARERVRRFMRMRVRPEVQRRGFGYMRVDLDQLTDEDYFDYNHLNSRGIDKFSAMLSEELEPRLALDRPERAARAATEIPVPTVTASGGS